MVNPFDKTFFHFLFGFILILCLSFSVLYFTTKYEDRIDGRGVSASVEQNESI